MNLLVTGGAGFIGSHLIRFLIGLPSIDRLVNLDALTYAGRLENLVGIHGQHPRYTFEQVDLRHAAEVHRVVQAHDITHVIHLAAESHVDRSIEKAGVFVETNVLGTLHLLEACRLHWQDSKDHKWVHVSTDEVFGSLALGDAAFNENTPYHPNSPYSASKAASDHLVRAWHHTHGLPTVVTNASNNYGPFQFPEKLIPMTILKVLSGEGIPLYGSGENVRDWLHVEDHCAALWAVLEKGRIGETYCIGAGQERRNVDLMKELCEILDEERANLALSFSQAVPAASLITPVRDRPGHDFRYAVNSEKIRKELGWQAEKNLHQGLRETVRWYLQNLDWLAAVSGHKSWTS